MRRPYPRRFSPWLLILATLLSGCTGTAGRAIDTHSAEKAVVSTVAADAVAPAPIAVESTPPTAALPRATASPTATLIPTPLPPTATVQPSPSPAPAQAATMGATASPEVVVAPKATGDQTQASATAEPDPSPTETPLGDGTLVVAGLEVYKEQYCGVCHQLGTAGTGGLFGPSHDGMGTTAGQRIQAPDYGGAATTAQDYLVESIVQPKAYLVPGYENSSHAMPAYTALSDEEIMALVQFLFAEQ